MGPLNHTEKPFCDGGMAAAYLKLLRFLDFAGFRLQASLSF
jgi:hypothetical protein